MSLPSASTTIRPYTSYHLFSQLEREYILQTLLGFTPTLSSAEVFNPTDYPDIPPLPSRYDGIILMWDWHMPGKSQRRKRKHRKSHGKIGFQELNKRISRAWSLVSDEVRNFCTVLSEIEGRKHKKSKREEKKKNRKSEATKATKSTESTPKVDDFGFDWTIGISGLDESVSSKAEKSIESTPNYSVCDFDWTVKVDNFPWESCTANGVARLDENVSSTMFSRFVSLDDEGDDFVPRRSSGGDLAEVDMSDGEVIDIWHRTRAEDEISSNSTLATCEACEAAVPLHDTVPHDGSRKSFIDAEYERFKNIGKDFIYAKRQNMPTTPTRMSNTASQA